mmetsp:Transcript_12287/g.28214  ORF Transcript_12287/g.28214 Transcript_12287/m.28214 type:complete len:432 (+) Transcript_12287:60-1355(+)|eukprot:CAMPEP_0204350588 /NCGR_PEP_ID=MMETSP0469-20131031/30456_1 /ASSEMBLY_ACC=CAM_ASM_000384 /TAXON_ID=2969 /ORGANISM="Oxyrrhis marina" /LENGTH=431 /DNA_ID=CAMNT_0051336977 /DNA_START=34 /DNA_END=1329 /DNA_ORIENTATION=+
MDGRKGASRGYVLDPRPIEASFRTFVKRDLEAIRPGLTRDRQAGRSVDPTVKEFRGVHSVLVTDPLNPPFEVDASTVMQVTLRILECFKLRHVRVQCVKPLVKELLVHVFWVAYLCSFQRNGEEFLGALREHIANKWSKLPVIIPQACRDATLLVLPFLMAEAVMDAFRESFPASQPFFAADGFDEHIYGIVVRELTGIEVCSATVVAIKQRHFPTRKKATRGGEPFRVAYHDGEPTATKCGGDAKQISPSKSSRSWTSASRCASAGLLTTKVSPMLELKTSSSTIFTTWDNGIVVQFRPQAKARSAGPVSVQESAKSAGVFGGSREGEDAADEREKEKEKPRRSGNQRRNRRPTGGALVEGSARVRHDALRLLRTHETLLKPRPHFKGSEFPRLVMAEDMEKNKENKVKSRNWQSLLAEIRARSTSGDGD